MSNAITFNLTDKQFQQLLALKGPANVLPVTSYANQTAVIVKGQPKTQKQPFNKKPLISKGQHWIVAGFMGLTVLGYTFRPTLSPYVNNIIKKVMPSPITPSAINTRGWKVDPKLLVIIGKWETLTGCTAKASPAKGAIGRHKGKSSVTRHNIDRYGTVMAMDIMPINCSYNPELWLVSAQKAGAGGVGFYPNWRKSGKIHPGIHLDSRPQKYKKLPTTWIDRGHGKNHRYGDIAGLTLVNQNPNHDHYIQKLKKAERQQGIPTGLLVAISHHESARFRPDIVNCKKYGVTGDIGIMQFHPKTAKHLKVDPCNIDQAINKASLYLVDLHREFGDWSLATLAYNWGRGNVKRNLSSICDVRNAHYPVKVFTTSLLFGIGTKNIKLHKSLRCV